MQIFSEQSDMLFCTKLKRLSKIVKFNWLFPLTTILKNKKLILEKIKFWNLLKKIFKNLKSDY